MSLGKGQSEILGGPDTNAAMDRSPYANTGADIGTVAGNKINGSTERASDYINTYLTLEDQKGELYKKSGMFAGLAILLATACGVIINTSPSVLTNYWLIGIVALGIAALAAAVACGTRFYQAKRVANNITDGAEKDIFNQAAKNTSLSMAITAEEADNKADMAQSNIDTAASINDVKNKARKMTANSNLNQQLGLYSKIATNTGKEISRLNDTLSGAGSIGDIGSTITSLTDLANNASYMTRQG